ncbi:protein DETOXIFICATION 16-like isoform X2 [Cicer arietinum]|uniref:protein DETOXIFICATION 16-like isoform X2 n=1 Tax=Cicer arietinum TaxID=3827 RepID=UPI003CC5AB8A
MKIRRKEIIKEAKKQLWMSGPMIFVCLFQNSLLLISLMFVGHLDRELVLAGASLATSFLNVSGFNVMMGLSSVLDTFCGQVYGAQQYHMVGIYTQRAMLVTTLLSIPLSIIWAYLEPILIILHQNKAIAAQAQIYARYSIPSLCANGFLRCIIKFLQTQNIVYPMMLATGFTSIIHVVLCWALVMKIGLGLKGAAIAICISNWFNVILLVIYIKLSPSCKRTWVGLSRESLHNIPPFLKLAFPSTIMVCLESWTFELMVLLSGALSNPKLQTSVLSICTRISNELGAGRPNGAYLAAIVTLFMAFTSGVLEFAFIMSVWKVWGKAFSNVDQVVTYVTSMTPLVATSAFVDSIQTVLTGVSRGCGRQKLGAFVNLGSFYLVGVPLSAIFAFVIHMNGQGLLLGLIIALVVVVVCLLIITLHTNWEKETNKAAKRVGEGNGVQINALSLDQSVTIL